MNRNRLSEFIARRKEESGGDDSQPPSSLGSLDDAGTNEDMEKYLTALGGIERDIALASNGVDELGVLHGRLLSTADGTKAEVEQMNENTEVSPSDRAKRRGRHTVLVRRLMGVLDKYRALERESQKRYRTRMEKHIRLGKVLK
ncbi:hypothetical protein GGI20_002597 [Coemansia sp. BCRC 34301]|nr:hypothetical protein GGI20_002597 [Coemansia sp. BCRC 34301]